MLCLSGKGDAFVDVHQNVAGPQGQIIQSDKPDGSGRSLQTGKASCGVVWVCDQSKTEVQATEGKTHLIAGTAIDTGKSRDLMTTDRDKLRVLNDRTVGQGHSLTALLNGKTTRHAKEAEQVDAQVASGFDDLTLAAVKGERQSVAIAAGVNTHLCLAFRGAARDQSVINNLVVQFSSLVDADLQCRPGQGQPINACE